MSATEHAKAQDNVDGAVHIEASKLGTKEYWDSRYDMELVNFIESGDEGEVWFGRSAENRIIKYLVENHKKDTAVLDLGCGNGSVLRRLREKGYKNLSGVDYCKAAIELATNASKEDEEETGVKISYNVFDILNAEDVAHLHNEFSVVLDKGTWDAMSLCEAEERAKRLKSYAEAVLRATKDPIEDGPLPELVIISCNFTCAELREQFEQFPFFRFKCEIPAASSFSFGGTTGVTSSGVVFYRLRSC